MNNNAKQTPRALPKGAVLSHKYIIDTVIGEGGFGITYTCTSNYTTDSNVIYAVKEYYPDNAAYRVFDNNSHKISPYMGKQDVFEKGRKHFLKEAGILSKFTYLEHIVSIHDIIEENDTIYIVMEYIDGITLKQYVEDNEPLTIDELSALIVPVMRDLSEIHNKGLLHRDISPDNLILGTDNRLHLIDFGSADFENAGEIEMKTVMLKPGFAPPEQYIADGRLGAWTDVYGICATMYYALTGFAPTDSLMRRKEDDLPSLSAHSQIRSWQADVIMKGLNLHPADRYQSMEALYMAFIIPPVEISAEKKAMLTSVKYGKTVMPSDNNNGSNKSRHLILKIAIACIVIIVLYAGIGFSGATLPLWPESWTYASFNNPSDNSTDNTDNQKQHTTTNNRSTVTTTTENRKTTNTSDVTDTSDSSTNNTQSKDNKTEKTGGTTPGTKDYQKSTEKTTSTQSKDTFIPLPDDEYDTFTD